MNLSARRTVVIIAAAAAVAIAVLAAATVISARLVHEAARTVTVTRVVHDPALVRTVTKWRTRTVTHTVTVTEPSAPPTVPCIVEDGVPWPGDPGAGDTQSADSSCTVTIQQETPSSAGSLLILTDPSGVSSSFQIGTRQ